MSTVGHRESTLAAKLSECRAEGRAALIGFMTGGFPDVDSSRAVLRTMVESGCDIVEVGIAYSDPMMDGPTIQAASDRALAGGVRVRDTFDFVAEVREAGGVPLVMSYWNPVRAYGVDAFARDLAAAGGAGMITPDLIPEEAGEWLEASEKYGLDRCFLVAPSSTPERLAMTLSHTSGFSYIQAVMGVTGARDSVSDAPRELTARVRALSDIPCAVGLGVRSREHAAEIAGYADGVIVGSALIDAADDGLDTLAALTAELADGVRQGGTR